MNMVKVDIQARETIKPSSSTPQNLKIFKLSLLDQIAPPEYVPRIFYYACNDKAKFIKPQERINQLKESLSQALTLINPLAGRVRENLFIECNDEGVDFLEAKVNCTLLEILNQPEVSMLDQFLPHDYHCNKSSMTAQLAIQVNIFSCGGMAIGTCASHKIVDGGTFSSFLNMWAEITSGAGDYLSPIFPGPNLFPPRDLSGLVPRFEVPKANPTRIEVVSALIWKCAMVVSKAKSGSLSPSIMTHAVDLRPINDPPQPKCATGNLSWLAIASAPTMESPIELHHLANEIRNPIQKIDKEYIRKMQGENGFSVMSDSLKQIGETKNFEVFSWANYKLYEADFGWGKPIWVSTAALAFKNIIIFIETRVNSGLEAWVTMEEQDMDIFEQNQELCSFVDSIEYV
ncbi:hypothetical protein ACB098_04G148600 [Castanea mollissima]